MSLTPPSFQLSSFADLKKVSDGVVRWIWRGYLAQGSLTLLTSRWKSGKTTLLSLLLAGGAAAVSWPARR